ncbi:MAG: ABC transporter permease [Roseburia sp.]|nr:ABC transporter permease [Roseburia sp.]
MLLEKDAMEIRISIGDVNKLSLECHAKGVAQYAYYIYKDNAVIAKFQYSDQNTLAYWLSESGEYWVKVFAMDEKENKISRMSEHIYFSAEEVFGSCQVEAKKKHLWERVAEISGEICSNWNIVVRMSSFDYKLENKDTYLGKLWALITPLIQIGTYWLVFGLGLRQGKDVDGYPYLAWMLIGLIPWFFISSWMLKAANSIYSKTGIISKMKFPISTIPVSKVLQELYEFVVMLLIMLVILLCLGLRPNWYWLNLIYYFVYCMCFLIGLGLITSVLTMVARDFYKLMNSLIRLLFYVTPILWVMDKMPDIYQQIMQFNPIFYVVNGFRESILYHLPFYHQMDMVLIMWGINVVLFFAGCALQSKFKNKFIDLM